MLPRLSLLASLLLVAAGLRAAEEKLFFSFEDEAELKKWEIKNCQPALSDEHATNGKKSLKVASNAYFVSFQLPRDWSGFDSLEIDIFVDGNDTVGGSLLIGDVPWEQKGRDYWDRHNGSFNLKPGENTVSVPVNGLYRGEAGSRGNSLKTNIDPKQITRFDMGFKGKATALYIDNMRLTKETRPEGILAFDFGPESQTVFPGFTPISFKTVFGKDGAKAGMKRAGWGASIARDDTFPTRLYQDWVEMSTDPDMNEFVAEAPSGKYQAWVVFDDCGYWGGETCHHKRRAISNNGKEVWIDERGENGPTDYLYRFENVEPRPGDSMWDLYMKDLFKPARFPVESVDNKISLTFKADTGWSMKVAAVILYPEAKKAEAEKWVAEIEARNRKEFETRAAFVGPKPKELTVPPDATAKGYWLGFPSLEETISLVDAPGKPDMKLARIGAKGQRLSFTFAIRPLKDLGEATLTATDLTGPGKIPPSDIDLRYVQHLTRRGFNDIAYQIEPTSLRPAAGSGLKLAKDFTRQFWITVAIPADAAPGAYSGQVTLDAGGTKISVPLSLEVLNLKLDEPDFCFGFYGVWTPSGYSNPAQVKELLTLLKDNGMNSFTGGPNLQFKGFAADGKPEIDFKACDEFFKIVKECGYSKEIQAYGGPGMVSGLHDGYVIGETGHNWEKKTGKPFKELLKIVWGAVKEHADKEGWPQIAYGFTDEPRVLEVAQAQVELMKAYREAVPFVKIGGSYSVHWGESPLDKAIQEIFKTLVWSGLNSHNDTDLAKAKEFGREIYIYNQGISRYSFGAYQWAEMRKGVKARMQWHLLALHGYQYFDLDGREPDTAMINWGRKAIHPTIHLPRCREGADDFRFAVTLWNLAEKKKDTPEGKAAQEFLEGVNKQIKVAERNPEKDWMGDEAFRLQCIDHIRKLLK